MKGKKGKEAKKSGKKSELSMYSNPAFLGASGPGAFEAGGISINIVPGPAKEGEGTYETLGAAAVPPRTSRSRRSKRPTDSTSREDAL